MSAISVASQIDKISNHSLRLSLAAWWISNRIAFIQFCAGVAFTMYYVDNARTIRDMLTWATDGHLLGFLMATYIAPFWRMSTAYQRSKQNEPPSAGGSA